MADRPVKFKIEAEGGRSAATEFERLKVAQQEAAEEAGRLSRELQQLTTAEGASEEQVKRLRLELVRARERVKEFGKAADDASGDVDKIEESSSEFNNSLTELSSGLSLVKEGLSAVGAVLSTATGGIVSFLQEMEARQGVLNRFEGDIGEATDRLGRMASAMELATLRNRLMSRGVDLSAHDFANVAVAIQETASAIGEDFMTVADQMIDAMGSQSPEALQRFGVRATQGRTIAAQFADTLRQLDSNFGDVSSSADTAGGGLEAVKNAADDAATAFLSAIAESGGLEAGFAALFNTVTGGSYTFEEALQFMVDRVRLWGAAIGLTLVRAADQFNVFMDSVRMAASGDLAGAASLLQSEIMAGIRHNRTGEMWAEEVSQLAGTSRDRMEGRGTGPERSSFRGQIQRSSGPSAFDRMIGGLADGPVETEEGVRRDIALEEAAQRDAMRMDQLQKENEYQQSLVTLERESTEQRLQIKRTLNEQWLNETRRHLEDQRRAHQEFLEELEQGSMRMLGPLTQGLTEALSSIIAGTKSAEEAFQGLLSSFLGTIAQQAGLEAAKEYAAAIASFASYQYDAGGLHLAAGAAWTAVAVAAGAASVAVAPAAAASGPASPQTSGAAEGGGGNSYTFNVNGPVLSAGTKANLGREVSDLTIDAQRRFGRAA